MFWEYLVIQYNIIGGDNVEAIYLNLNLFCPNIHCARFWWVSGTCEVLRNCILLSNLPLAITRFMSLPVSVVKAISPLPPGLTAQCLSHSANILISLLLEEIMTTLTPCQNPHSFFTHFRGWTWPSFGPEDLSSTKKDYLFQGHCSHVTLVMNFSRL